RQEPYGRANNPNLDSLPAQRALQRAALLQGRNDRFVGSHVPAVTRCGSSVARQKPVSWWHRYGESQTTKNRAHEVPAPPAQRVYRQPEKGRDNPQNGSEHTLRLPAPTAAPVGAAAAPTLPATG